MSKVDNGGPAFPRQANMTNGGSAGMTLRDYFAAKAMQGLISRQGSPDLEYESRLAYQMADAMLAARSQP